MVYCTALCPPIPAEDLCTIHDGDGWHHCDAALVDGGSPHQGLHICLCGAQWMGSADAQSIEWRTLALHALSDLVALGVDIRLISGVNDDVMRQVGEYDREGYT